MLQNRLTLVRRLYFLSAFLLCIVKGHRAVENFVSNEFTASRNPRNKRDVSTSIDDNGNQVTSTSSSGDDGQSYSYTSTNGAGAGSSSVAGSSARGK